MGKVSGTGKLILNMAYDWSTVVSNVYAIFADLEQGHFSSAGISVGSILSIALNFQI
jgi:hypothetical protein